MADVLTLDNLSSGEFSARGADATPPYFAVFGKPISHSMSPIMQNAALKELGKTNKNFALSKYFAFEIDPNDLACALPIFWDKNFAGINLTIPHKEVVMDILDDLDESAARARACNTLLRTPRGWKGFNTDGFGLEAAIANAFGSSFENADVVILGAGGAARGAAFHIASRKCKTLTIANRSVERLEKFVGDLRKCGIDANAIPLDDCEKSIPENALIINATSIGLKDSDSPVVDFSRLPCGAKFFDMPYRKGCETVSVLAAHACSIPAESGLPMLAWQGAKSLSIWTGADAKSCGELMLKTLQENSL